MAAPLPFSAQIRNYVLHPYKMVKDVRTNHETGNVEAVMNGELMPFLKSYLMSEISFEVSNLKELENKYQEISKVINNKGFDFAALQYSISPTSNLGGKLDWINENNKF